MGDIAPWEVGDSFQMGLQIQFDEGQYFAWTLGGAITLVVDTAEAAIREGEQLFADDEDDDPIPIFLADKTHARCIAVIKEDA